MLNFPQPQTQTPISKPKSPSQTPNLTVNPKMGNMIVFPNNVHAVS